MALGIRLMGTQCCQAEQGKNEGRQGQIGRRIMQGESLQVSIRVSEPISWEPGNERGERQGFMYHRGHWELIISQVELEYFHVEYGSARRLLEEVGLSKTFKNG